MRILLIEDNPTNAGEFLSMLHQNGFANVVHQSSGIEGLQAAKAEAFDLILIDFDLPDLYGTHVGLALYWLMRRNKIPTAPMIALTAQSRAASELEAAQLGFSAFIGKPCTEADLLNTVRQLTKAT
jgi:CheY-like chemotaxis protein